VMTTRSDIMAGLPKMNLSQPYVLHMTWAETFPVLKMLVLLIAEQNALQIRVFVSKEHEWNHSRAGYPVSLWYHGLFETPCAMTGWNRSVTLAFWSWPWLLLHIIHMMISGDIILFMWLKGPLEAANHLVGPSSKATHRGVNRARLVDQHWEETILRRTEYCQRWVHTSSDTLSRRLHLMLALSSKTLNGSQREGTSYCCCHRELLGPCCPEQLDDDIWSILWEADQQ
jgi:hypothetical protein